MTKNRTQPAANPTTMSVLFPALEKVYINVCRPEAPAPIPSRDPVAVDQGAPVPTQPHRHPLPLLRLEVRDISSAGAQAFLSHVDLASLVSTAVNESLDVLYPDAPVRSPADASSPSAPAHRPVQSVRLVLRAFPGVAHTRGSDLDDSHKEIHLSTDYVAGVAPAGRVRDEVVGVVCHEMVHCFQWDGRGTCPGGLVEGIADYVRLRCGHGPPHWERRWRDCAWDDGYEKTAYFLEWLECRFGPGTVVGINARLRDFVYEEKAFWESCCGSDIDALWKEYCDDCDRKFGAEVKN